MSNFLTFFGLHQPLIGADAPLLAMFMLVPIYGFIAYFGTRKPLKRADLKK